MASSRPLLTMLRPLRRLPAALQAVMLLLAWLALGCEPAPGLGPDVSPSRGALVVAVESEPTSTPPALAAPAPTQAAPAAVAEVEPSVLPAVAAAAEPARSPAAAAVQSRTAAAPAAATGSVEAATFSPQRAMRHVEYLADTIGPRVAGGPGVALAADYLATQFTAAGLSVERQTFPFSAFADRGSSLAVLTPSPASLTTATLSHSAGGEVEGDLVEVGLARVGDFEPSAVRGRVALALRGEIRFGDKAANLAQAGASGLVIANNQPGNFAGSLGGQASLPVVAISQADGERLRDQVASSPTRVRLVVDADTAERSGVNVEGLWPGGSQTVIIGAHYDSVSAGPGANDNASGTATMLELARVIGARQYPFTVRFVGFDAEEIGLIGSNRYVGQLDNTTREATLAMINLDMVGVGDRLAFGGDSALIEPALRAASGLGTGAGRMRGGAGSSSDHASFQAAGIPALFVYRGEDPNYHSAGDQARQVSPEHLATAGNVVLAVLDDLAAGQR